MKRCRLIFAQIWIVLLLLAPLLTSPVKAAPLKPDEIPETLKPWIPWALHGHEEQRCPFFQGKAGEKQCDWPSHLQLTLRSNGGSFQISWTTYAKTFVPLPGDETHWPQQVKANGQSVPVVSRKGNQPYLLLEPGTYAITGSYQWETLPESLQIPASIGVLQLSVEGQNIAFPQRDEGGLIWIQKESKEETEDNRLEMRVHRMLLDQIPFEMVTRLTFDVSGKSQEVILPQVLLKDFIPMSLESSLPARLEPNGDLRIQVRPGTWSIDILSRSPHFVQELTLGEHPSPWPKEEIWVFQAFSDLRLVTLEGVPSIDPQQTTLPDDWKRLPAYRLQPGDTIHMIEKRRGNAEPPADQLNLFREWWLDFDGKGFTVRDEITGVLNRSWRLEINPPAQLGRVNVDGKDQFITRLPGDPRVGVEIRQGHVEIGADSRIPERSRNVPAVSWEQTFQNVKAQLNLPPGWTLLAVSGADHVPETWINQWTLLELFLVLITVLTFWKLWGWKWGVISLFALALTFPERGSPQWVWLAVLVGCALLRLLPKGKLFTLIKVYRLGAILVLLAISIPFLIQQVRVGVYPSLEYPYRSMEGQSVEEQYQRRILERGRETDVKNKTTESSEEDGYEAQDLYKDESSTVAPQSAPIKEGIVLRRQDKWMPSSGRLVLKKPVQDTLNLAEHRPGTKVQTGPGLPAWSWNQFSIGWSGPVSGQQMIGLYLIPPWANLLLSILRVLLLIALLICVLGLPSNFYKNIFKKRAWVTVALLLIAVFGTSTIAKANEFPTPEMLNELRDKLLEDLICYPTCAILSHMSLEANPQWLRLHLRAEVQSTSAVPIPGGMKDWLPTSATDVGQTNLSVFLDDSGQLWMLLTPGIHEVVLEGPLPDRDTVSITLPLKPYFTEAKVNGWILQGLRENGEVDDNLQLTRSKSGLEIDEPKLGGSSNGALPAFVQIERRLILGLTWEIQTTVRRITPLGTPIVLEVPLLSGESITTDGVRVDKNKVMLSMAPGDETTEWHSVLQESKAIELKAPDNPAYMETWQLEVSPVWHVNFKGIPTIHPAQTTGLWMPEWRPWPGESLTIGVERPEGVQGQTLTVDQSILQMTPGLRYTDSQLNFTLRSSLGGQHVIKLPKNAQLKSVSINGQSQPIRQEGNQVTLPVVPGSQRIELTWQESRGIQALFRGSSVDLGLPSVNSEIQIRISNNRWILYAGGPRMGPAVLFWSLFLVLLIFSFGLSRLGITPLKTFSWLLLGLGISQFPAAHAVAGILVVGWFLLMGWRCRQTEWGRFKFDLRQVFLVFYTFVFLIVLFASIHKGLLGNPEMQIAGNGSTPYLLRWFQDRSASTLSQPYFFSLPVFYYRLAMLSWALWIAWSLIAWLKWGWKCFSSGGLWRPLGKIVRSEPSK